MCICFASSSLFVCRGGQVDYGDKPSFAMASKHLGDLASVSQDKVPLVRPIFVSENTRSSTRRRYCGVRFGEHQVQPHNEDSYNQDSDASPSPPWILQAAAEWASLAHRLLVRQDIRNGHCCLKAALEHPNGSEYARHHVLARYLLNTLGRRLQTFKHGTDPFSTRDIWS